MKKIYFLLVFVVLFGFVGLNEAKADCPPNWALLTFVTDIDGCLYSITYCYKCGVTGADPANIKVWRWAKLPYEQQPNPENCGTEVTWEQVWEKIRQDFMQRCQFPPCNPPGQQLNIIVEYPLCRKTFNHAWQDQQGNWKHFVWEEPCNVDLYYCQFIMAVCYLGNGKYSSDCISAQAFGNAQSCLAQKPLLPSPGLSWYEDWESDCYIAESCQCPPRKP